MEQLSWLEDKLERTLHWNPHAAGVVGRTAGMAFGRVKTPRLEKASRVKRRSGHDARDKCPMPSALCQNRNTPVAPDKLTTITYRQILAVLAPDAKSVLSHILSEGPHVRVGPDRYDPSLYSNTPMAPELSHCPSQKSSSTLAVGQDAPADARAPTDNKEVGVARKENAVLLQDKKQFQWRKGDRGELPPPDELILRTLLQVQQGEVDNVSVDEMVSDEAFLSSTLLVCEQCALLVNRWAQYRIDIEAQADARAHVLMDKLLPAKPSHHRHR